MPGYLIDPRLRDLPIGSKERFAAQRTMIKSKPLIKRCYDLWYRHLLRDAASVPDQSGPMIIVELGSGSGYIKEVCPDVITSDVVPGAGDLVTDARHLPFASSSIRAILVSHVFHHIPEVELFLQEAGRVLVPGGVISMIEVSHTLFSRFFFSAFHPEPYDDRAPMWSFSQTNSMLDSNQALSWIVFVRDRARFQRCFPMFQVEKFSYLPWFSYLASGGVNLRSFVPQVLTFGVVCLDRLMKPFDPVFAIHWHLTIRKVW